MSSGEADSASYDPRTERRCRVCGEAKPRSEFYAHQGNTCKTCSNLASRARKKNNPNYRATRRAWEQRNVNRPVSRRKSRLKRRYRLTPFKIQLMLEKQQWRCLICRTDIRHPDAPNPESDPQATMAVVDHDHFDGHVRGMLCSACNVGLGQFDDDPRIIREAFKYLKNDLSSRSISIRDRFPNPLGYVEE